MAEAMLSPAGIRLDVCRRFDTLVAEIGVGAGAVLLPEEGVTANHRMALRSVLAGQLPWSDLPILILARTGADSAETAEAVRTLGNVTLLERPLRGSTLLSAVRTAIRARDRQYQIREHLADRARTEEALRQADQRKDEFLATLGHELRNPLSPLLTALQMLNVSGPRDVVTTRLSAVMERQVRHLIRLVNDLLEVSRITRGLIEVQRENVDIATVIQAAIDNCRSEFDAAGHELLVEVPSSPMTVHGDPIRLTQIFTNLIANAAKYTADGGRIRVSARLIRDRVVVSIRDSGIGIPPHQLVSVFDMFTQVDRSNRRAQGGLGIGLTLVKSLVTMHGGRVEARSAGLGAGSEFVVELPVVSAPATETPDRAPANAFPTRRVLVVDDNVDAAQTLGQLLSALGASVKVAYGGQDAMAALETFDPQVVLLDIGMPELDGYEVARRIRASDRHRHVVIIALTGWGQEHDRRQTRAAGFDHHVVKPPDIDALRELLIKAG
jgi:signal transduction histidine kinase/CheY-like chemotaxis protein